MSGKDFSLISQSPYKTQTLPSGKLIESELRSPMKNYYVSQANVFTKEEVDLIVENNNQCMVNHEGTFVRDKQEVERIKLLNKQQENEMLELNQSLQQKKNGIENAEKKCEEILYRKNFSFFQYQKYVDTCARQFESPMKNFTLKSPLKDDAFDIYIENPDKIRSNNMNEIQILSTNNNNREITTQTCDINEEVKSENIVSSDLDINQTKEELESIYNQLIPDISNLEVKLDRINDAFILENEKIKSFIKVLDKKHEKKYTCKKCYKKFKIDQNHQGACSYHSGYLKYYSCRSCGADEYYTCCNKCSDCSEGCKTGKHAAILEEDDLKIGA